MGSEWKEYRLGDLAKWYSGGTPSKSNEDYWNGEIPWISASSMRGNRYSESGLKITPEGAKNGSRLVPPETILLLVRGSILHQRVPVGITEAEVAFNQDVKALIPDLEIIDPWFLLLWFMANEKNLLGMVENTGIGAGKFDTKLIQNLKVNVPPKHLREAIVTFGKALDDKIALLRQMNETLEQMAQALFQSWFVDFDPVIDKALAAGHDIPEPLQARAARRRELGDKRKPLPAEIADLFPDNFTFHEEMGWVPEGWEVATIDKIAKVTGGGTPSTKIDEYFCEDGIPWLSPKDLSGYPWKFISRGAKDITQLGLEKSSAKLMPEGTVLFSSRAPIGYVAIAENQLTTNQGFKSLLPHSLEWRDYLYYYLSSNKEYIESISSGSTFKEVSGSVMKGISILQPPHGVLFCFADRIEPSNQRQKIVRHEVEALTTLRDTLLPKLISGEVEVGPFSNKISKNV